MPTFVYKGRNRMNEIVTGERVAENRETLERLLRRDQVILTSAREKGKELALPKLGGGGSVGAKDLSIFTRQFSVMIDAGLPLVQCLETLPEHQPNNSSKQAPTNTRNAFEPGRPRAVWRPKNPKALAR